MSLPRSLLALVTLAGLMVASLPASANGYLQCVPFARAESGVDLFGNAETWWAQAAGRFDRGREPRVGAVMAMAGTRAMPLGHVAVVSRIVNDREILINHANWSPIGGRRGQVERNVRAIDVSAAGDWSQIRIWYAPTGELGLRPNPVQGFIYPAGNAGGQAIEKPIWASTGWKPGHGLDRIAASLSVGN